jgi:hypothetical protein
MFLQKINTSPSQRHGRPCWKLLATALGLLATLLLHELLLFAHALELLFLFTTALLGQQSLHLCLSKRAQPCLLYTMTLQTQTT